MIDSTLSIALDSHKTTRNSPVAGNRQLALPLPYYLADATNCLAHVVAGCCTARRWPYNPILLVGAKDTGKSALAHGLAQRWSKHNRPGKLLAVNGTELARSYTTAIQADALDDMRRKFGTAQFLLIDDLHQIAHRKPAQIELCTIMDRRLSEQRPMLCTMRRLPSEYPRLVPGLVSRLSGGLIVPLRPPGRAARRAILEQLAQRYAISLSPSSVSLLADGLAGTVPQLAHAVTQLAKLQADNSGMIDHQRVQRFLAARRASTSPSLRSVTTAVARYFGQKTSELRGPTRRHAVATTRGIAMYLSRRLTNMTLHQIGAYFGHRDHTTVLHACRKVQSLMESDPKTKQVIDRLCQSFDTW